MTKVHHLTQLTRSEGDEKMRSVYYVVMCDREFGDNSLKPKSSFAICAHALTCVQPVAVIPSICLIFLDLFYPTLTH